MDVERNCCCKEDKQLVEEARTKPEFHCIDESRKLYFMFPYWILMAIYRLLWQSAFHLVTKKEKGVGRGGS